MSEGSSALGTHSGIDLHSTGKSFDHTQSSKIVPHMLEQAHEQGERGLSSNANPTFSLAAKEFGFASSHSTSNIHIRCACDHEAYMCRVCDVRCLHAEFSDWCITHASCFKSYFNMLSEAASYISVCKSGAETQTLCSACNVKRVMLCIANTDQ